MPCQPSVGAIGRATRGRALRRRRCSPVRASHGSISSGRVERSARSSIREAGALEEAAPLGRSVVANVAGVAEPVSACLGRLADESVSSITTTRCGDAGHLADGLLDVLEVMRRRGGVTTASKLASANGRSSAARSTSACIPGAGSKVTTSRPPRAAGARRGRRRSRRRGRSRPRAGSHHSTTRSRSAPDA